MTDSVQDNEGVQNTPHLEFIGSPGLTDWLAVQNISLVLTSYSTGKLFLVGRKPDGQMSVFERTFQRCMGLWTDAQTLWLASLYEIWKFENIVPAGRLHEGYDRCYVPRLGYITGDLNVHDIALDSNGQLLFVNTLFNCLACVSDTHNFKPLWRPPFIQNLIAEDQCHLNGMALQDGQPRYASMFARVNEAQGWRQHRLNGGCVVDLETGEYVVEGLSMPHSPRLYRGKLWLLHSGTGDFGYVDTDKREFVPVTFCPGYVRGLSFCGDYAIVGTSKGREDDMFQELPLHRSLEDRRQSVRCGVSVIDLRSGELVHFLWIEGVVTQLYDVAVLPGVTRPMAIGFKTDEVQRMISLPPGRPG